MVATRLEDVKIVVIGETSYLGSAPQRNSSVKEVLWIELHPYERNMWEMKMSRHCVRGMTSPSCESLRLRN